jgi:hypothetical protein
MTSTAAYLLIKTAYARHGGIGASNEGTQHRRMRSGNPNTQEYDTAVILAVFGKVPKDFDIG